MSVRVVVIEDHPLMLKAIITELASQPDIQVVGSAEHGSELPRLVREKSPNVVILDLGMASGNFEPVSAIRSILQEHPALRILVLTGYDEEIQIRQVIQAGAYGYVLKSDDLSLTLPEGVRRVSEGKRFYSEEVINKLFDAQQSSSPRLNEHELAVLKLAAQGLSNEGIAQTINISEKRVRNLLSSVYSKLDLHESDTIHVRIAAINKARDLGMLSAD
jgi:two-component system NarL family response regulator